MNWQSRFKGSIFFSLGNYLTQTCSVFLTSIGIFLLALATWQYSIAEPHCCYDIITNASSVKVSGGGSSSGCCHGDVSQLQNWSSNCTELHKEVILSRAAFNMSPELIITVALLGLVVCMHG